MTQKTPIQRAALAGALASTNPTVRAHAERRVATMGEEARWTFYQRFIAEHTKDIDPRHVEAWMRVEHPTLDGLSRREFIEEMYAALACAIDAGPEQSEALAASFGL